MRWFIIITFLISLVHCSVFPTDDKLHGRRFFVVNSAPAKNSALEELVRELLESLRHDMVEGSSDIPVLDPFHLQHLNIDGAELDFPGSHITLHNVVINHLSTFVVDSLAVTLQSLLPPRYNLDLELCIPLIEIPKGTYDALINAMGFRVFGAGNIRLKITNIRVKVHLLLGASIRLSGAYLNIRESDIHLALDTFQSALTGIFYDPMATAFINAFLASFVPDFVRVYEAEISTIAGEYIMQIGNDILQDINVIDIIGNM